MTHDEILSNYTVDPITGCWLWLSAKRGKGYGAAWSKERREIVDTHRYFYQAHNGPIPEGLLVRHSCDNPLCCNPEHLLVGTVQDNSDDMVKRGRSTKGAKNAMWGKTGAANPFFGRTHTAETKQKISEVMLSSKNPFRGKKFTDEHRANLSAALKAHHATNTSKKLGVKHTEEHRRRLSFAARFKTVKSLLIVWGPL